MRTQKSVGSSRRSCSVRRAQAAGAVALVLDLSRVYELYVDRVYAFFAYRSARPADAEDLTAATFERIVRSVDRFDAAKGALATWIFAIAENVLIDHYRRQGRRDEQALPDTDDAPVPAMTSLDAPSEGLGPELQRAVAALGPREQQVIGLRFGGDLSGREIADLLEISESNVHQILSRALRRMRTQLGDVRPVR